MIYILLIAGIFGAELGIKNHVEKHRKEEEERPALGGALLLRKYHNRGAFLDMGERVRPLVAFVSVLLSLVMTAVFVMTLGSRGSAVLKTGLALLLGGAYSNTYDRLRRKYVVDYFSFGVKWQKLRRVVFNLSDFCIAVGAMMLVLGSGTE